MTSVSVSRLSMTSKVSAIFCRKFHDYTKVRASHDHYIFRELSPSFIFSWTTIANISWNALLVTAVHLNMKLVDKFYWKVLNILTSFLWSVRVQTMEKCCRFVFHNRIDSFDVHFPWSFSENRSREREKNKFATITHFQGLCSNPP